MRSRAAARGLPLDQVLEIATAIGLALTYAHRFTIHRDIKPENIWVEEDGGYKLMDFGIARLLTGSQLTQTAAVLGSAYYMAPEALKDSKNIDGRADQYSLAVVLYEAICGEVPMARVKSLAERVKGISRAFSKAIDRALETQAEARFADIGSFVAALSVRGLRLRDNPWLPYTGEILALILLSIGAAIAWPYIRGSKSTVEESRGGPANVGPGGAVVDWRMARIDQFEKGILAMQDGYSRAVQGESQTSMRSFVDSSWKTHQLSFGGDLLRIVGTVSSQGKIAAESLRAAASSGSADETLVASTYDDMWCRYQIMRELLREAMATNEAALNNQQSASSQQIDRLWPDRGLPSKTKCNLIMGHPLF
jgi:serine/threonine protein kinase